MPHPLVVHCMRDAYDIYIGRGHGNVLGNNYSHQVVSLAEFRVKTRAEAIEAFEADARERIKTDPIFRKAIRDCYMKRLGCFCAPKPCHGEVIVKLAAELVAEEQANGI